MTNSEETPKNDLESTVNLLRSRLQSVLRDEKDRALAQKIADTIGKYHHRKYHHRDRVRSATEAGKHKKTSENSK